MTWTIGPSVIGLAAYSYPWRCGFAGAETNRVCTQPYTAEGLIDRAAGFGMSSVEFPVTLVANLDARHLRDLSARANGHGLQIVADSGMVDVATLERHIPAAAALGARVLRVVLSPMLEGARATFPGGWAPHLNEMIARLRQLRPVAEEYNIIVAPENHQDATSAELIRICDEVGGEHIGVTLDAVNPLAVGEEPLAFARALGTRIVDVHLKDYLIYLSPSGYRLVRCALGDGVLDLPGLFSLLAEVAPTATCNIELAALNARHIRLYENEWWEGYPARDIRDVAPLLRLLMDHARPLDEDWRTPWERGGPAAELGAYEETQMERSVAYLRTLGGTNI